VQVAVAALLEINVTNDTFSCVFEFSKDHPHRPCECGDEHDGPHCEYTKGAVPDCDLECKNDGQCQLGFKDYKESLAQYQNYWEDNFNLTLMHCLCPDGYFGSLCEIASTKCNNMICFNGGACSKTANEDGDIVQQCNCSTAGGGNRTFSGKYCQYEATTFCANEKKTDSGHATFCLNGGTCKNDRYVTRPAYMTNFLCRVSTHMSTLLVVHTAI
jgi:hypothetical protein